MKTDCRTWAARGAFSAGLAAAVLCAQFSHAANVQVRAGASYIDGNNAQGSDFPPNVSAAGGTVALTASNMSLGTGGSASSLASLGVLKAALSAGAARGNVFDGNASIGRTSASAFWDDTFVVAGAGLSGSGVVRASLFIDIPAGAGLFNSGVTGLGGSFLASSSVDIFARANSVVLFNLHSEATLTNNGGSAFTTLNGLPLTGGFAGFWTVEIPVVFGQVSSMEMSVTTMANALAGSNSTANSWAAFGNSIYWAGIQSVSDGSGVVSTNFSALGSTGQDWRQSLVPTTAVPEPAAAVLMLAGLGLVAAAVRRRKTTGPADFKAAPGATAAAG